MSDLITRALVRLDADLGAEKHDVIRALARIVSDAGRTADPDLLAGDAITREGTAPTGLAGGIAIPHCRTEAVDEPTLAFVRLSPPVEFGAKDGPADLAFRSVSGDLELTGGSLTGLRASTTSGDVRLASPLSGGTDNAIETMSGDARIVAAATFRP